MVVRVPAGALLGPALGWPATFWAVVLLCVPAAFGILTGIRREPRAAQDEHSDGPSLVFELAQLCAACLFTAMLLAAFAFRAPVVTGAADLGQIWVPVALVLFVLVLLLEALAFAAGSTVIVRVLHAASEAPTLGGS